MPIASAKLINGTCRFEALGDSVVYAVIANHDGKLTALENPFILANGKKVSLVPDNSRVDPQISIDRQMDERMGTNVRRSI